MNKRIMTVSIVVSLLLITCVAWAGTDSKAGNVNGMSCTATLSVSTSTVSATTKSIPANSSYIYVRAVGYMYTDETAAHVLNTDVSYSGAMEVSASVNPTIATFHHGRGVHYVDAWLAETVALP